MKRLLLSGLLLTALYGCESRPVAPQQCAPMEPYPAELEQEPQNLNLLLDRIITPCDGGTTDSTVCSSSVGRN